MGIFSRMTDIINSNINAILDRAEDPEKIIRMVIQEMEDTLVEVRSSAARTIADQKDLDRRIAKIRKAADEWERKAELALSKGREDLAKGALYEKSRMAEQQAALEEQKEALANALSTHEEDVSKLEAKLKEARAKKASLQARHRSASNQVRVRRNLYDNRIHDAFERFDKVESRIDRLEGEAEALDMGRNPSPGESLADEIDAMDKDGALESELEALKAKLAKKSGGDAASAKSGKANRK
ncbi:phage shock protein PspA [Yunchengibacter salinarum]|uniref:phage shock protein PspA n=1 Tax=Yunchengibacter salinarum TaxID=3133399 RepID=UPI0035B666DA